MQPVFFKTEWHFDERFIGAMMALNGIVIIAFEMVIIHKLEGKRHPLFFIILGTLITGTGFVLTNLLPPGVTAAVIIVLLIAFGEILALPFMNTFWISRTNSFNQGEYGALYSMAWATAQILSPSIGSFIIMSKGYNMLWWILAICCVAAAFGFSTIHRKLKQLHVFATN
jgi:predicted MFS family arabinose efflux permease